MKHCFLLWHQDQPIGMIIFSAPAASLTLRSQYFGLSNPRSRVAMSALNRQLWVLQRVVLHPTYRGAGIAAAFVSKACDLCPVPWIETLSVMGRINPFFEKAGFKRVGVIDKSSKRGGHAYAHGRPVQSTTSEPVYYVRKNQTSADA